MMHIQAERQTNVNELLIWLNMLLELTPGDNMQVQTHKCYRGQVYTVSTDLSIRHKVVSLRVMKATLMLTKFLA